jgi:flagellar hook-basal body complex protein FliE
MEINTKVDQLLGQMRAAQSLATKLTERVTENKGVGVDAAAAKPDFASVLKSSIDQVNQAQQASQALTTDFELGKPGVQLHEVMIGMSKASVQFQQMVQVRNKLVSAYQDIMNMQV